MADRTSSQDGDWHATATWGGSSVPTVLQSVSVGHALHVKATSGGTSYTAEALSLVGGGSIELRTGSTLNCVNVTDVTLDVAGASVIINSVNAPGTITNNSVDYGVVVRVTGAVTGYSDIYNSNTGSGLYIQQGEVTEWHGDVTNSGNYGIQTSIGSIKAWYGDVINSGNYGVSNVGCNITAWYGDVNSSSGSGVYLKTDGHIDTWYGDITNSGDCGVNHNSSSAITAWYGDVINSGSAYINIGVYSCNSDMGVGGITAWYGNVYNSASGSYGIGVYNTNKIIAWYGSVTCSGSGGVYNLGDIVAWYGDVTCSGSFGVNNAGNITAWYGDVTNSGSYGVNSAGNITAWYGDVTDSGYYAGVENRGTITAWYGNVVTGYISNDGTISNWYARSDCSANFSDTGTGYLSWNAAALASIKAEKQLMLYGGTINHAAYLNPVTLEYHTDLPGYHKNMPIAPAQRVQPGSVRSGTKVLATDPVDTVGHIGTLSAAAFTADIAAATKILTGEPRWTGATGANVGSRPYTTKHGALR